MIAPGAWFRASMNSCIYNSPLGEWTLANADVGEMGLIIAVVKDEDNMVWGLVLFGDHRLGWVMVLKDEVL